MTGTLGICLSFQVRATIRVDAHDLVLEAVISA